MASTPWPWPSRTRRHLRIVSATDVHSVFEATNRTYIAPGNHESCKAKRKDVAETEHCSDAHPDLESVAGRDCAPPIHSCDMKPPEFLPVACLAHTPRPNSRIPFDTQGRWPSYPSETFRATR